MFPNPQDALPLPSRPNLEQYKNLAKDLAKAANSPNQELLRDWLTRWIESLVKLSSLTFTPQLPVRIDRWIDQLEEFTRHRKNSSRRFSLSVAQFVLARAHGFESWPKFARHLEAMSRSNTAVANFERAAEAIVNGDLKTLASLLQKNPRLIRARSTREHRATLLHYVAANGVEGYRQKTPNNAVEIATLLLNSGADLNATADVYGGGATTLVLAATSLHPEQAGVQGSLLDLLLQRGAAVDETVINAALANGRPQAAEFLAARGVRLDLESAAGLGNLDQVKKFFDKNGNLAAGGTKQKLDRGFLCAAEYGRNEVIEFLLQHGANLESQANMGQTALHCAIIGEHLETVRLLLKRGANLETKNSYGGTALGQALWCAVHNSQVDYIPIIRTLLQTGAHVDAEILPWLARQKDVSPQVIEGISQNLKQPR